MKVEVCTAIFDLYVTVWLILSVTLKIYMVFFFAQRALLVALVKG